MQWSEVQKHMVEAEEATVSCRPVTMRWLWNMGFNYLTELRPLGPVEGGRGSRGLNCLVDSLWCFGYLAVGLCFPRELLGAGGGECA